LLIDALAEHGIEARISSGLNCWIPVADESATLASMRAAGYACAPGARFRIEAPPAIRVTIARLSARDAAGFAGAFASSRHTSTSTRST
jgi:hypothetical protein